ncbi:GNAT family N-acetyltransferase [Luteimonas vadosa]|uniref:GNAT family N-acetyltransferase n=1 Tax=Luteimonas vadosa TaxID=1165507 RepID=A0ABP9DV96_9GAMM
MPYDLKATLQGLPDFPRLEGPRVRLRGPRDQDTDALFAVFSDPRVMRYWSRSAMATPSEAAALIVEIGERFEQRETINWVVADLQDDAVIGTCTLYQFSPRHRRGEIGYTLRSDLWGRGLAREAVALAVDWAFDVLALHRVEADVDPRNEPSRRLLQALGFRSEGVARERFFVEDQPTDSEWFGLLAADWRKRNA